LFTTYGENVWLAGLAIHQPSNNEANDDTGDTENPKD